VYLCGPRLQPNATKTELLWCDISTSLITTRLHYDRVTLAGIPGYPLDGLQSVLNAATRLVYLSCTNYDHTVRHMHLFRDLHWLRVAAEYISGWPYSSSACRHNTALRSRARLH